LYLTFENLEIQKKINNKIYYFNQTQNKISKNREIRGCIIYTITKKYKREKNMLNLSLHQ